MKKAIQSVFVVSLLLLSFNSFSQNLYWVNSGGGNWSDPNNWSSTSPSVTPVASAPGAGNVAIFNGVSGFDGICTFDLTPTVQAIQIVAGYTGNLDLNGFNLNISSSSATTISAASIQNSGGVGSTITINNTTGGNISLSNTSIANTVNLAVTLNGNTTFTCGASTTIDANIAVNLNGVFGSTGGFVAGGINCVFNGTVIVTTSAAGGSNKSFTGNTNATFRNSVDVTARSILLNGSTYEQVAS